MKKNMMILLSISLLCRLLSGCKLGAAGEVDGDVNVVISTKANHHHCLACGYDWYSTSLVVPMCPRCESMCIENVMDETLEVSE